MVARKLTTRNIIFDIALVLVTLSFALFFQIITFSSEGDLISPFTVAVTICALFCRTHFAPFAAILFGGAVMDFFILAPGSLFTFGSSVGKINLWTFVSGGLLTTLVCFYRLKTLDLNRAAKHQGQIVAEIAHDLRSPLNSLALTSMVMRQMCSAENTSNAAVLRMVESIECSIRQQTHLVESIMDSTRIIDGKLNLNKEPNDLHEIVRTVMVAFAVVADRKQIHLSFECEIYPLLVLCDKSRIVRVLSNILDNAIKYTNPHGSILVHSYLENSSAYITIADTGSGIPRKKIDRIFDKGVQVDPKDGGLGYGLCVAKKIVQLHGGSISVQSEIGHGSIFTVRIPLHKEPSREEPNVPKRLRTVIERTEMAKD